MSKRMIIFIYVVAVLLFSGFLAQAKTTEVSVAVTTVQLDQNGVFHMSGQLSTPCLTKPTAYLEKVDQDKNLITLSVVAVNSNQRCIEMLGDKYDVMVNLNELPLIQGHEYSIVVNNFAGRTHIDYIAPKNAGYFDMNNFDQASFNNLPEFTDKNVLVKGYEIQVSGHSEIVPVSVSVLN